MAHRRRRECGERWGIRCFSLQMAEGVGFEPTNESPRWRFSSRLAPVQSTCKRTYSGAGCGHRRSPSFLVADQGLSTGHLLAHGAQWRAPKRALRSPLPGPPQREVRRRTAGWERQGWRSCRRLRALSGSPDPLSQGHDDPLRCEAARPSERLDLVVETRRVDQEHRGRSEHEDEHCDAESGEPASAGA
jgi:hypothetical protein